VKRKKRKRPKNPLLQQKFDEGYALGIQHGIQKSTSFFIEKFEGLENVKGVGPKTLAIIRNQLGNQYFEEVKK